MESPPTDVPSPMTLTSLPDECVRHVLSLLSLCALGSTACTCRSLRDLAAEPSLWRQLFSVVWQSELPVSSGARSARRAFVDRLAVYRRLADLRMSVSGPASRYLAEELVMEDGGEGAASDDGGGAASAAPPVAPGAGGDDHPDGASEPGPGAAGWPSSFCSAAAAPPSASQAARGSSARVVQELRWTGREEQTHEDHTVGVACLSVPLPAWPVGVPTRYMRHPARALYIVRVAGAVASRGLGSEWDLSGSSILGIPVWNPLVPPGDHMRSQIS
eukprot:scaffold3538_cov105-Isochrysis_galbana.AAC.4